MKKYFLLIAVLFCNGILSAQVLPNEKEATNNFANALINENYVGTTFYDFQTNGSSGNRILMNSDGTISAVWNFSPNAIQTTTPPFPSRGSGYNYWDGTNWLYPSGPTLRQEPVRAGFPNIVVTPSGKEMIITHSSKGSSIDSMYIVINWRAVKGLGSWDTLIKPWGMDSCFALPKAIGGFTNEKVYMVFQKKSASAIGQIPPASIDGYYGPLYFARSLDGGITWSSPVLISLTDSNHYKGFTGDSYSIMASGDTVAISFGHAFMDVGLLKSTDAGLTWTKQIIYLHPHPMYDIANDSLSDSNHDGIPDTILTNGGDSKVLIDNNGMCHIWFSAFSYLNDTVGDTTLTVFPRTDNLFYWNETMPMNNGYVSIASAQDFNGNGIIDVPMDTFTNCTIGVHWGDYGGGFTQMPSAGIDPSGRIYLAYQTIDERTDTSQFHMLHKHIFVMTLTPSAGFYDPASWTYPYSIIPDTSMGGYGEFQEAVFACMAPKIIGNDICVIYQRDDAPGHALGPIGSCTQFLNLGNLSDIIITKEDVNIVGVFPVNGNNLSGLNLYPNPANEKVNVSYSLKEMSHVSVQVFDMTGRIVLSELRSNQSAGKQILQLNISGLTKGIYSILLDANGERVNRKLIIQR